MKRFLEDVNGVPYTDEAAFVSRFGTTATCIMNEKTGLRAPELSAAEPSEITNHVASRVCAFRTLRFREILESAKSGNEPDDDDAHSDASGSSAHSAARALKAANIHSEASAESSDEVRPQRKRRAKGVSSGAQESSDTPAPRQHLTDAQKVVLQHLRSTDRVHMECAKFQDWAKSEACEALSGKVTLILTDPPYNSRRNSNSPNSEHDVLSGLDMTMAADIFCKMLRPGGQLFIFCSFSQWHEWTDALNRSGGGNVLKASQTPEIIVRHPEAVTGDSRFSYYRKNVCECAVHAFKRITGGEANVQDEYARQVVFTDSLLNPLSGSDMPVYAAVMNNYRPPVGREVLRSEGVVVRPEQKSVSLLRDIIRIFAPGPTDIIVDLFAGTMSTVAAALMEGRPVYSCEMDKRCFELGAERIRALAYRRAAAGLVPGLSDEHIQELKKIVSSHEHAVDMLDHADETEINRAPVVVATVRVEEEDEITPRND